MHRNGALSGNGNGNSNGQVTSTWPFLFEREERRFVLSGGG
jgi:hypothetical protein